MLVAVAALRYLVAAAQAATLILHPMWSPTQRTTLLLELVALAGQQQSTSQTTGQLAQIQLHLMRPLLVVVAAAQTSTAEAAGLVVAVEPGLLVDIWVATELPVKETMAALG